MTTKRTHLAKHRGEAQKGRAETCYALESARTFQKELYEAASGDAKKRADRLRRNGFATMIAGGFVATTATGGHARMTWLVIYKRNGRAIPPPVKIEGGSRHAQA